MAGLVAGAVESPALPAEELEEPSGCDASGRFFAGGVVCAGDVVLVEFDWPGAGWAGELPDSAASGSEASGAVSGAGAEVAALPGFCADSSG